MVLTLFGAACDRGTEDLTGTIVSGCTTECRPGSIEAAVLGKSFDAYQANRLVRIVDEDTLEIVDDHFDPVAFVDLDVGERKITRVHPWLEDSLIVMVGSRWTDTDDSVLWVIGPDLTIERMVPVEPGFHVVTARALDLVVEGARSATQDHQAIVRASHLGGPPLWTFSHPTISSIDAVVASSDGSVLAYGQYSGELDLGTGIVLTTAPQSFDGFTVKLDANGEPLWLSREYRFKPAALRSGATIIANGSEVITIVDTGAIASTVTLDSAQLTPSSILADDTSTLISGDDGGNLFLARVEGPTPAFLLEGYHDARSSLHLFGMNEQSTFGRVSQYFFECREPCRQPTYTVDDVTITGYATVRFHR